MVNRWMVWTGIFLACLWLAACETSQPVSLDAIKTRNAQTLDQLNKRYLTEGNWPFPTPLTLTPTQSPVFTDTVDLQITPSASASASPTSAPCYRARVLSESPEPYTNQIALGEHFVKTWKLLNTGSCKWPAAVQLVYVQVTKNLTADILDQMSGPDQQAIGVEVPVGGTVDMQVALIAPLSPGQYAGYWMLRNTYGGRFGEGLQGESAFSVTLSLRTKMATGSSPTATNLPRTATPTPTSAPTMTDAPTSEPPTATLPPTAILLPPTAETPSDIPSGG